VSRLASDETQPSPNLPILTRGTDIACAMRSGTLVPHSTIAALRQHQFAGNVEWDPDASEIDVWVALMTGATVTVTAAPATVAA
jgi:hypothetical protein